MKIDFNTGNSEMHTDTVHETGHVLLLAAEGIPFGCVSLAHRGPQRGHTGGIGMPPESAVPLNNPMRTAYERVAIAGVLAEHLFTSDHEPTPADVAAKVSENEGDRVWIQRLAPESPEFAALVHSTWATLNARRGAFVRMAVRLSDDGVVDAKTALTVLNVDAGAVVLQPCFWCDGSLARLRVCRGSE